MIKIVVAGGSRPEIFEMVKRSRESYGDRLQWTIFDSRQNVDQEDNWTYFPCHQEEEVADAAVRYVAEGHGQILMKGIIQTHSFLKALLKSDYQLRKTKVLSHVAHIEVIGREKAFLLTDSAMNIQPDEQTWPKIIDNAIEVAHQIGIPCPKVALLSAAENINPKMKSSVMGQEVTKLYADRKDAIVFGPLSLDLSLSLEAVAHKQYEGPIKGDADIVVVPGIDAGNVLYKSLAIFAKAKIGGALVGSKVPVILTSRGDSVENKLASLDFAIQQLTGGQQG